MAGIYIHIPFCKQRCTYCDFHFSTSFSTYRSKMIKVMIKEATDRAAELKNETVSTIYFGGGTPSILNKSELLQIKSALYQSYKIEPEIEWTLETNPDDITIENLKDWKEIGVNRLSIGIQSFRQKDLDWMNRAHTAEESLQCVQMAKDQGFLALSIDLIYGLPDTTSEEWREQLQIASSFDAEHISAYCLTVEKGTLLHNHVKSGKIIPATEDNEAIQFQILCDVLSRQGYERYEVSNFAKNQRYSEHNSNYWKNALFIGIGPSAHSYNRSTRRFNIANNTQYMQKLEKGEAYFEMEVLSEIDQFNELLLTGLRTKWGVEKSKLNAKLISAEFTQKVSDFKDRGYLLETDSHYLLTQSGFLLADYLTSELFQA